MDKEQLKRQLIKEIKAKAEKLGRQDILDQVSALEARRTPSPVQFAEQAQQMEAMQPGLNPLLADQLVGEAVASGGWEQSFEAEQPGKVVDIATGAAPARLAAGQLMGAGYTAKDVQDWITTQKNLPSGADIIEKSKTFEGEPIKQAIASTALEVLDPGMLTLMTGLAKAGGKKLYKNAFKDADWLARKFKKGPVSDTLFKYGITGSAEEVFDKSQDVANALKQQKNTIIQAADEGGAKATTLAPRLQQLSDQLDAVIKGKNEAAAREALSAKNMLDAQIERIKKVPSKTETVEKVSPLFGPRGEKIVSIETKNIPSIDLTPSLKEADEIKTSLAKSANWKVIGEAGDTGEKALKEMATIAKESVEEGAGSLGKQLKQTNRDLGDILTAQSSLYKEAGKEARKAGNPITKIDALVAAVDPVAAIAGKGGDLIKSSAFKTKVGYGLTRPVGSVIGGVGGTIAVKTPRTVYDLLQEKYGNQ